MPNLRQQLSESLRGRVCLVGLGNPDRGDDGLGVRLAESFQARSASGPPASFARQTAAPAETLVAGLNPERHLERLAHGGFDHVVFLDAVEFGGDPGSVVFLNSEQMSNRFPQISTHRLSLGLMGRMIEAEGGARAWLLGVQPATVAERNQLTAAVRTTLEALAEMLRDVLAPEQAEALC